ncbi:AAA family ATPase [Vibrio tritonius]|uniref:AAA family ATPase n=1 Tax=Vibrio tritonius TaxID=1435069 RepID=UPI00315DF6A1
MSNTLSLSYSYTNNTKTVGELFKFDAPEDAPISSMLLPVRQYLLNGKPVNHPMVPVVDLDQIFTIEMIADVIPYLVSRAGAVPFLFGPQGSGKTSSIRQFNARLNLPQSHLILGEDTEVRELGQIMVPNESGGMTKVPGALYKAMQNGWVLHIDEYDLLPRRQQKLLNEVLENYTLSLDGMDANLKAHEDFRVMISANTNNTGSMFGFTSEKGYDSSINERFQFIRTHYLPEKQEIEFLESYALAYFREKRAGTEESVLNVRMKAISKLINFAVRDIATLIRKKNESDEELTTTLSLRVLKEWILKTIIYQDFFQGFDGKEPIAMALERTYISGLLPDEQSIVRQLFEDKFAKLF